MDFHKPKAAHSWREFLIEIGTIICGIVIALGLEQLLSNMEWARKVAETRESLGLEVADNLAKLDHRVKQSRCINQRLDALAAIVDRAAKTGSLPALATPAQPGNMSWSTGVWTSALSSQGASHFAPEELRGYSRVYQILERIIEIEPKEEATWATLYELAGPGRPFDAQDARAYRTAIGQAREMNGLISGFGVRERQAVDGYHIAYDPKLFAQRVTRNRTPSGCGAPTGIPPAAYGAAPDANFAEGALRYPTR